MMKQLSAETVRLLSSAQVASSVWSVVKELLENSLDAHASSVEAKLENYGFDKIEVRDNGDGVRSEDTQFMAVRHYTSKISSHEDLEDIATYGFRGEGLGSICAVAEVSITTCTAEDEVSMIYSLDSQGHVTSKKPSHLGKGTTVCITKLFKNLPVRKQFYSTAKKCKEELKKIEDLLVAYGVIHPDIRFSLAHNKAVVWQKPRVADQRTALLRCLGTTVMGSMIPVQHQASTMQLSISGFVPKPGSDPGITSSTGSDRCLVAINGRPVHYKDLLKLVRQYYRNTSPSSSTHYPVFFLSLSIPANTIDVNLTPDKMQVMLHNKEAILAELDEMLLQVYGPLNVQNEEQVEGMASVASIGISCENYKETDDPQVDITTTLPTPLSHRSKGENTETKSITISKNTSVNTFVGENQELDNFDDILGDCLYTSKKPDESSVSGLGHDCPVVNTNEFGLILSESVGSLATELEEIENEQPNFKETFGERETSCDNPVGIAKSPPELTTDSWSRGTGLKDSAGCPLEPVKVYTPGLESADSGERNIFTSTGGSSFNKSPRKKIGFLDGKVGQSTAYDLLGNRAVRKPQEARQFFLKERRADLQAENPGASPEEMRILLFDEWEQLPPELRRRYEAKATKDLENYNKQLEMAANLYSKKKQQQQQQGDNRQLSTPKAAARNGVHKRKMNAVSPPDNQPRLDQLLLAPKSEAQAPVLPCVREVPFSLPSIRQKLQLLREYSQSQKSDDGPKPVKLLMPLGSRGAWLGQAGNSLVAINHFRLEEAMLYRRLLQSHILPIENLGIPITLNQSLLGSSQYLELLPSLQSETRPPDPSLYITDQRLLANGFHVRILNNGVSGEWEAELEGLATSLPYYGVSDLGEVLDAILHKHATEVEHCRPLKLVNYLQGEAVRMARQLPRHLVREDMEEKLCRMRRLLPDGSSNCIHGHPFFPPIASIPTLDT